MIEIWGTLGPACADEEILYRMLSAGMTGVRLNLSHTTLSDSAEILDAFSRAKERFLRVGVSATGSKLVAMRGVHDGLPEPAIDLLIDLQGAELRIGALAAELRLNAGDEVSIPMPTQVGALLRAGQRILLDDGKILAEVVAVGTVPDVSAAHDATSGTVRTVPAVPVKIRTLRGGILRSGKSLKIEDYETDLPPLTDSDYESLQLAKDYGVTAVMLPFVRSADDIHFVRDAMRKAGVGDLRLFAKIENREGVSHLDEILAALRTRDMLVIARGDLGNAMPLYGLPAAQEKIENACKKAGVPYLVVTELLASMVENETPTRAEVADIYFSAKRGASALMATNETAVGKYPVEVISYLAKTVETCV